MKVFVDANVLFSAAYSPHSHCGLLLTGSASKGIQLITCDYAADEALRNLKLKAPQALERFPAFLKACALVYTTAKGEVPPGLPAKDHPIWLSARAAGCEVLLTGDKKDFGRLKDKRLRVMVPGALFDEVFK